MIPIIYVWIPWHLIIIHIILYIYSHPVMLLCLPFVLSVSWWSHVLAFQHHSNTWPAKANKPWISLPKGLGVKLSIIEATEFPKGPGGVHLWKWEVNHSKNGGSYLWYCFFSITRHTRHMVLFVQYWGGNGGNLLISTFRKQEKLWFNVMYNHQYWDTIGKQCGSITYGLLQST